MNFDVQPAEELEQLRAEYIRWAKPSVSADSVASDELCGTAVYQRRPARLAHALQRHMMAAEAEFRRSSRQCPMLVAYQSDGTSYLTLWTKQLGSAADSQVSRRPHDLCEFLSERWWLARASGGVMRETLPLVRIPRLLRLGKGAAVHLGAMRDHLRHPSSGGHQSIAVSFFSFDRAMFLQ